MSLWTVFTQSIRPESLSAYEESMRKLAARAVERRDAFHWNAYQTAMGELGSYYYVSGAQDWNELETRGTAEAMVLRLLGEKEGARWLEDVRGCAQAASYTVSTDRPELSYLPDAAPPPSPFALVTAVRVRSDGLETFEEFIRKIAEAIPKVGDPARILTRQMLIGDLREYRIVRPLQRLADLDGQLQPSDLLTRAFGAAEGGLLYRTGLAAIEAVERRVVARREDLSNPS